MDQVKSVIDRLCPYHNSNTEPFPVVDLRVIIYIQGGPGNTTHPYLLKFLLVAEILLIILFQIEKVP